MVTSDTTDNKTTNFLQLWKDYVCLFIQNLDFSGRWSPGAAAVGNDPGEGLIVSESRLCQLFANRFELIIFNIN